MKQFKNNNIKTPAFLYNETEVLAAMNNVQRLTREHCSLLFPLKSFTVLTGIFLIADKIDGFSCSSLFEAKLAKDISKNHKSIHLTTPGLRHDDILYVSKNREYFEMEK